MDGVSIGGQLGRGERSRLDMHHYFVYHPSEVIRQAIEADFKVSDRASFRSMTTGNGFYMNNRVHGNH
jgi:hypothetical protein